MRWARLVVRLDTGHAFAMARLLWRHGNRKCSLPLSTDWFVITFRANQIVAGMGINMLALGLSPVLCKILYDVDGLDTRNPARGTIPIRSTLVELDLRRSVLARDETPAQDFGRPFAGENPEALEAAGIRVNRCGGRQFSSAARSQESAEHRSQFIYRHSFSRT